MKLPAKNALEWSVFGLSLAIVAGLVVFLVAQIADADDEPARIMVEAGPAESRDGQLIVPVSASNEGDEVAEDIVVEVTLERPGATPETVELTFPRLARLEQAAGEAVFPGAGGQPGQAEARVLSYHTP